jgi:hypothetical protein
MVAMVALVGSAIGYVAYTALKLPSDVVRGPSKVVVSSAGGCAVWPDGAMRCWGVDEYVGYGYANWLWLKGERPWASPSPRAPVTDVAFPTYAVWAERPGACAITHDGMLTCTGHRRWVEGSARWIAPLASAPEMHGLRSPVLADRRVCAIARWGDEPDESVWCVDRESVANPDGPVVSHGWRRMQLDSPRTLALSPRELCALGRAGRVRCVWLADGRVREVAGIESATEIALGADFGCAIDRGRRVACWGDNDAGQLGDGAQTPHDDARSVPLDGSLTSLSAYDRRACVLRDGAPWCWGLQRPEASLPALVARSPERAADLEGLQSLSVSAWFACGIRASDRTVWCWGNDSAGQLGDGSALPMGGCDREGISGSSPERERLFGPTAVRTGEAGAYPRARGPLMLLLALVIAAPWALVRAAWKHGYERIHAALLVALFVPIFVTRLAAALFTISERTCPVGVACAPMWVRSPEPLAIVAVLTVSFAAVVGVYVSIRRASDVARAARRGALLVATVAVPALLGAMQFTGRLNERLKEDLAYRLRDAVVANWWLPLFVQWCWTLAWIAFAVAFVLAALLRPRSGAAAARAVAQ